MTTLPIDAVLPDLLVALRASGRAVLQAPPGAGKTTRVPLAMLDAGLVEGRIVMLEPRRLAARAAAERMAETLGEPVGHTVGYRMRGDTKVSKSTRIEVVTEGILTRMIQSDPELSGIGALIFDEFHERSLNADLGLALAWESRGALREDLVLLVMSATLDAEPVAQLLDDAPVITSQGQSFPVEIKWLERPLPKNARLESEVAGMVFRAITETDGGVLVFLPGEGEIRRVHAALGDLPKGVVVRPLYGALPFAEQRKAVEPVGQGCKVVLSTSIAETALTIQDVRVVVDAGRARRARYDPTRGLSRLVTERVSKAEATQRTGRAGRVAPGVSYRMWTKGEEGGFAAFPPPEIASADLAGLVLELALWGAAANDLAFLTSPPAGILEEAGQLLMSLDAIDDAGRITPHGRKIAALPLHPRLAHMLEVAGPDAARLAAMLQDRDPLRGQGADLELRLRAMAEPRSHPQARRALDRISGEAKRLRRMVSAKTTLTAAQQTALAYPDRVGLRRKGDEPRWILSGGTGVRMDNGDALAGARLLVVTDHDGQGREPKVRQAIVIGEAELREVLGHGIGWQQQCAWSGRERRVSARKREMLGAIVLDDRRWDNVPEAAVAAAFLDGIREIGLHWSDPARRLQARIELLRRDGMDLPDCGDDTLMDELEGWILPYCAGRKTADDIRSLPLLEALNVRLGWERARLVDEHAPANFVTPLGRKVPVDYGGGNPTIEVRLQELFGVTKHPVIGPKHVPIQITLLSPAGRPVQTTQDLPGFWESSYTDVRKDMRGRYPRHPWPENPMQAEPTLRAKRRR